MVLSQARLIPRRRCFLCPPAPRNHRQRRTHVRPMSSQKQMELADYYLMDIPTAARRMSTTVFAVRELCRSGELVYVPIGHKWLISPDAIRTFIRRKEQEAVRAA